MRRLALALALLLSPSAVAAQAPTTPFRCEERAFDLTVCTDPGDLDTCPQVCADMNDPATCAVLSLPELADLRRLDPAQPMLRQADVTGGPFTGAVLTMTTLTPSADTVFRGARDQLCQAPTPPPDEEPDAPPVAPPVVIGPVWYGPNPGINLFER